MKKLSIAIIEPYYIDSHKEWVDGLCQYTEHNTSLFTLPGKHWKWRMHGSAITLANHVTQKGEHIDLFLVSDMLDVATFKTLLGSAYNKTPICLYMHENQLTYPWSPTDEDPKLKRDRHYAWLNYTSALAADFVSFNSTYHKSSFLNALPSFLGAFPDFKNLDTISLIEAKSNVLFLGMPGIKTQKAKKLDKACLIWNHRWEYDKNPEGFFNCLYKLQENKLEFEVIVAGREFKNSPSIFSSAKKRLKDHVVHWGYAKSKLEYNLLLERANLIPVCNFQDFFGISVAEAIRHGAMPILPNRLAYPNYISTSKYPNHYYNSEKGLFQKLKQIIEDWPHSYTSLSHEIVQFDWDQIIPKYDQHFITCAN